ncbi:adenosylcobinamide-GDP ribazoletransferase [Tenacibaculum soleae]|uniref:adenosylcobinamide-GDP ribazoletransferase n=1 Tax=Tenacibaculum soleae TaxID=447689 RepID=UPI00349F43D9
MFFTALLFYIRIPIPKKVQDNKEYNKKSIKYLSLIGLLIGGISAFTLILSLTILPVSIAVVLSMVCSLLLTGGLSLRWFSRYCGWI